MVSAEIERDGRPVPAYGARPNGLLVFTADMHYIEILSDGDTPRFASEERGQGTDEENRIAMSRNIGMFGSYTVDESGEFSGNRVEGATFPNWIGNVRTRNELQMTVFGDRMVERFTRPGGAKVTIIFQRVKAH
ncbi:MAG: lipocalin-like domain-containing protein [Pseudoxanthomonas sp.]